MSDILDSSVGADEDPRRAPTSKRRTPTATHAGPERVPLPAPYGSCHHCRLWQGLSMLGMVVLHYAGSGIEELGGTVSSGPGIINGVFQLMSAACSSSCPRSATTSRFAGN